MLLLKTTTFFDSFKEINNNKINSLIKHKNIIIIF